MTEKQELQQIVHAQARACVKAFLAGRRGWQEMQTLRCQGEDLDALCARWGLKRLGEMWENDERSG